MYLWAFLCLLGICYNFFMGICKLFVVGSLYNKNSMATISHAVLIYKVKYSIVSMLNSDTETSATVQTAVSYH